MGDIINFNNDNSKEKQEYPRWLTIALDDKGMLKIFRHELSNAETIYVIELAKIVLLDEAINNAQ